jgi:hypothetical protein
MFPLERQKAIQCDLVAVPIQDHDADAWFTQ